MKPLFLAFLMGVSAAFSGAAETRKIILLAAGPSHGPGEHEHRAGMLLFQKCLASTPGIDVQVHSLTRNGWVPDEKIFDGAAAVVIFSDGAEGHPFLAADHLQKIGALAAKGVGLGLIHWATEPTLAKGQKEFLDWTGGAFELNYSVNPVFLGEFKSLPVHPVTRGVRPFSIRDEWYYHIRFRDGLRGVTPILTLVASESSLDRPTAPRIGPREGNADVWAAVRRGEPQTVMWVTERTDGGRGFGFTGGHIHANWANDDQRKLLLNALLWIAKVEVPASGVESKVTAEDLRANLDAKGQPGR